MVTVSAPDEPSTVVAATPICWFVVSFNAPVEFQVELLVSVMAAAVPGAVSTVPNRVSAFCADTACGITLTPGPVVPTDPVCRKAIPESGKGMNAMIAAAESPAPEGLNV